MEIYSQKFRPKAFLAARKLSTEFSCEPCISTEFILMGGLSSTRLTCHMRLLHGFDVLPGMALERPAMALQRVPARPIATYTAHP
jgi:hypothetical protein